MPLVGAPLGPGGTNRPSSPLSRLLISSGVFNKAGYIVLATYSRTVWV